MIRAAVAVAFLLAGCAASPDIFGGAPEAHQISADTIQVSARGNARSDMGDVQRWVLRKAAEETVRLGYDHFYPIDAANASTHGAMILSSGLVAGIDKPGAVVTYRMGKGPAPEGAHDARETLSFLN